MEISDCQIQKIFQEFVCPIETVVKIMGGKWRSRILWELGKYGKPMRFGEIHKKLDGISDKTLAHQLYELELMKIIIRQDFLGFPPKVEYSLSDFGKTLKPLFNAAAQWIAENQEELRQVFHEKSRKIENNKSKTRKNAELIPLFD